LTTSVLAVMSAWSRVGSPCGDGLHFCCRQVGFCLFGKTPVGVVADKTDTVNAVLMCLGFWLFVAFAVAAACTYDPIYYMPLTPTIPTLGKVWSVALIVNGVLSLFPTYYSVIICNIFKAKILANQVWNMTNVMASIVFYSMSFEGYAFMMFAMGWSVAMFTVTARGSWRSGIPIAYLADVAFIIVTPLLAVVDNMLDTRSTCFYCFFAAACWFGGFTVWSSFEGYCHVHQFGLYPDKRLWQWKGPVTVQVPLSKEVPAAWDGSYKGPDA